MRCPNCGQTDDKVIDTRPSEENRVIRRRRECNSCGLRFSTIERIEGLQLKVIKKDGTRQEFSREKLMSGLSSACSKRPISNDQLTEIVNAVEALLQDQRNGEISSQAVGELVMNRLRELDKVAYVRFASVYRDFTDVSSFTREVEEINRDNE